MHRLAGALTGLDGLEAANANLMGEVTLTWDDEQDDARGAARGDGEVGLPRALPSLPERESRAPFRAF